jgi:two-component system response regulator
MLHATYDEQGMMMKDSTILLVEDNPDDEALTLRALKKGGICNKVFVAHDGTEVLDYLFCTNIYSDRDPRDMPQLILLELKLPKADGLEVLRRLRADIRTHRLPVVILASSDEEKDMVEGYKGGANSYMRKSVDFTQFADSIRQLSLYELVLNKMSSDKG